MLPGEGGWADFHERVVEKERVGNVLDARDAARSMKVKELKGVNKAY